MSPAVVAAVILTVFLALVMGYAIGRRTGQREGFLEGSAYAPLELRRKSWERGACIVCGRLAGERSASREVEATDTGAEIRSVESC